MRIVHHPGDPLQTDVTLAAGTVVDIRLEPASGYRWSTLTSSDPAVADVMATSAERSGAATATVALRAAGTASLTATTSYQPDRFGPPTRRWRLSVTVRR